MLAKKYRLPIQSVLNKSGRSFKGRCFLFKVFPSKMDFNRFGVIISKKVAKRATERNRLKRIVFDCAKKFAGQPAGAENKDNPPRPATECGGKFDILIVFLPSVAKSEKFDIIKELDESLEKIIKLSNH